MMAPGKPDSFIEFLRANKNTFDANMHQASSSSPPAVLTRVFNSFPLPNYLQELQKCFIDAVNKNELDPAWEHLVVGYITNDLLDRTTGLLKPEIYDMFSPELKKMLADGGYSQKEIASYVIDSYVTEFICGAYSIELGKYIEATDNGVVFTGFTEEANVNLVDRIAGKYQRDLASEKEQAKKAGGEFVPDEAIASIKGLIDDRKNNPANLFVLLTRQYQLVLKEIIFGLITKIRKDDVMDSVSYHRTEALVTSVLASYRGDIATPGLKALVNQYLTDHPVKAPRQTDATIDERADLLATRTSSATNSEERLRKTLNRSNDVLSLPPSESKGLSAKTQVVSLLTSLSSYQNQLYKTIDDNELSRVNLAKEYDNIMKLKSQHPIKEYVNYIIIAHLNTILTKVGQNPEAALSRFMDEWKKDYEQIMKYGINDDLIKRVNRFVMEPEMRAGLFNKGLGSHRKPPTIDPAVKREAPIPGQKK